MSRIVYVNGEYPKEEDAKVSIFDRGFLFGDGVYEVVPVINGQLVDEKYFLQRLDRSLGELSIAWPCSKEEYIEVMQQLVLRNDLKEGMIYTQVTRGVADRDFPFPADTTPSLIAFTTSKGLMENPEADAGIKIITTDDLRWKRRDIKSLNLLAQCLAKQEVVSKGADEGWMVEDGYITEGVSSTAYIVKDNQVITRPLSNLILPGIRRRTLIELAGQHGIELEERLFTIDEALQADEAFISSATTIALPVISIDDHKIGSGQPGTITKRLREYYKVRLLEEAAAKS